MKGFCLYLLEKLRKHGKFCVDAVVGFLLAYFVLYILGGVSFFEYLLPFQSFAYGVLLMLPLCVKPIAEDYMRWKWRWLLDY